jgi:hypothetical protein
MTGLKKSHILDNKEIKGEKKENEEGTEEENEV